MLPVLSMLALLSTVAHAGEPILVQGPVFEQRREAAALAQVVRAAGFRPRLQRRFLHAEGWRWTVVLRGYTDLGEAAGAAEQASSLTGRSYTVYGVEPITSPRPVQVGPAVGQVDPLEVALRARRSHGPVDALERVVQAESLTFRFTRWTADGRAIHHHYQRTATEISLRFWSKEDSEPSAEYLIRGDQAWVRQESGELVSRDLHRTRERIARFAPEQVLYPLLLLPRALVERRELALARPVELRSNDLEVLYRFDGDHLAGPARLWIESATARVLRFELGQGDSALLRELRGTLDHDLMLPRELITSRGGTEVDRIEVVELTLAATPERPLYGDQSLLPP